MIRIIEMKPAITFIVTGLLFGVADGLHLKRSALLGETAVLPCTVPTKTSAVKWQSFKLGLIATNERIEHQKNRFMLSERRDSSDWSLHILNFTMNDADTYNCSGGSYITEIDLSVGVAPYFEGYTGSVSKTVTRVAGEFTTLFCDAKGTPKPEISWYHIDPENQAKKAPMADMTVYTVPAEKIGSEEKIFCLAENTFGNVTLDILIKTLDRPTRLPDANDETKKLPSFETTQHVVSTTTRASSATKQGGNTKPTTRRAFNSTVEAASSSVQPEPLRMLTQTLFVVVIYSIPFIILV